MDEVLGIWVWMAMIAPELLINIDPRWHVPLAIFNGRDRWAGCSSSSPIPQLALKRGFKGGHGAIVPSEGGWISLLGAWGGNLPHLAVLEFHRT